MARFNAQILLLLILPALILSAADSGPVPNPIIYQGLQPPSVAPSGPDFTLTVLGNSFHYKSVVYWNNTPLNTQVLTTRYVTAVVPASADATPTTALIRVLSPKPYGGFSNTIYFPVSKPTSGVSFTSYVLPLPNEIFSMVAADFNGDGNLDLAYTETNSLYTGILLGKGDGTFSTPPIELRTCSGQDSFGQLVTADFNRDGIPDLAVGCGDRITVLKGIGDGTFHWHQDYLIGQKTWSLQTADINQDGKLDLIFLSSVGSDPSGSNTSISVLLGNGDGTFAQDALSFSSPYARQFVVGDFNRDGKLDLLVTSTEDLIFYAGLGDGMFNAPTYRIVSSPNPTGLYIADFNGDGALDLALTDVGNAYVYRGAGDGTFQSPHNYAPPGGAGGNALWWAPAITMEIHPVFHLFRKRRNYFSAATEWR